MRTSLARQGTVALGAAAAIIGLLACWPPAEASDKRWVVRPEPERPDAVAGGAADVAAAQKLARKKKFADAVVLLERAAREHPAVLHDCNLALAYLRNGQLTRAQLLWDVSRLRGARPPDWCDTSLASQLARALRAKHYVPLTLVVSPASATIEVGDAIFTGIGLVWLAPGTYTISATAPGTYAHALPVVVSAPSTRAEISLLPMGADPPRELDAGLAVDAAPAIDAAPTAVDAALDLDLDVEPPPAPPRARWPALAGVGAGGLGLGLGIAFHARALGTKDRANTLASASPAFADLRDRFGTERTVAIGGYVVSAAALGFAAWWWLGHDETRPPAPTIGLAVDGDGAMLTVGGPLR